MPYSAVGVKPQRCAFGDFSGVDSGDAAGVPISTRIGTTELLVNDVAAPLVAVRPDQINFLIPAATAAGRASIRVTRGGNTIASGTVYVGTAAPGLFSSALPDPSRPGAILNQDNSINAESKPAHAGEIIQIYATGAGSTAPPVPDGAPSPAAEVLYSGLSTEFPGLW